MRLKSLSSNLFHALILQSCLRIASMTAHAQWQGIGYFDLGASAFCEDTVNDRFYIAGQFKFYEDDSLHGIGYWKNDTMQRMGCGMDWDCTPYGFLNGVSPINELIIYHSTLYALGAFRTADGNLVNGITYWDGMGWRSIGSGLKVNDGTQGAGFGASIFSDTLYIYGVFDSIAGVEAHGLAKFDGSYWSSVHNLPLFGTYIQDPNFIYGAQYFDNELYIAGNFSNGNGDIQDLAKWNGTQWVGTGNVDGGNAAIYNMLVYKNELYISGDFNLLGDPQIAAHNIARFDGTTWKTVGGGTDYQINNMQVFNDYLYIAGTFDHTDGMPIQDIARWDGIRWCGYNSAFDNACNAVGMFRDTLYIGGGFWSINGDTSLRKVVRWLGGDSLYQCGNPVGVSESTTDNFQFSVFPNPTSDELIFTTSENGQLKITSELGQVIQTISICNKHQTISTEGIPSGTYLLSFQTDKTIQTKKIIIQH